MAKRGCRVVFDLECLTLADLCDAATDMVRAHTDLIERINLDRGTSYVLEAEQIKVNCYSDEEGRFVIESWYRSEDLEEVPGPPQNQTNPECHCLPATAGDSWIQCNIHGGPWREYVKARDKRYDPMDKFKDGNDRY